MSGDSTKPATLHDLYSLLSRALAMADELGLLPTAAHISSAIDYCDPESASRNGLRNDYSNDD